MLVRANASQTWHAVKSCLTINPKHASYQPKRAKSRFRHQTQTRELSIEIPKINFSAQSPETGKVFGRFFGKERGLERENPFYRKKWVLSLHEINNVAAVGLEYPVLDYPIFL